MTDEIIALDLETTGLNPRTDSILEIGAVRIKNGRVEDTYAAFINIGKKIPEFIVGLTGITDEMAAGGLSLPKALEGFFDFAGETPVLGHNITFDYSFLKQNFANLGRNFDREGIDTLAIAKKFRRSFRAAPWRPSAFTMASVRRRNTGPMRMRFRPTACTSVWAGNSRV